AIGCSLGDALVCELEMDLGEIVVRQLLSGVALEESGNEAPPADGAADAGMVVSTARLYPLAFRHVLSPEMPHGSYIPTVHRLNALLQRWEVPPGVGVRLALEPARRRRAPIRIPDDAWAVRWTETPVALWFSGLTNAIVT